MTEFRHTKYFFILGEPIPKWKVYLSVVSVLILIGGGVGFVYYTMLKNRSASVSVVEPPVQTVPARQAPSNEYASETTETSAIVKSRTRSVRVLPVSESRTALERLLEQHLKATHFDEVNSYLAEGTVGDLGEYQIILMARSPNLYKYKTRYLASGVVVEFGYDGHGAWLRGGPLELNRKAAEYFARLAAIESSVTHLAWSYLSSDASEYGLNSVLELLPSETWKGRACNVVLSHGILPIPIYHYIDSSTYREVYRRADVTDIGGKVVEVGIEFDPPTEGLACAFPDGYGLYIDGKLFDDVTFTKFRSDRVILSSLFDSPADSTFTDLDTKP
jgi:hypothetical protein